MNKLKHFGDIVLDVFYPTRCIVCRRAMSPGKPRICPDCDNTIAFVPEGSRKKGDFFSQCVSAVYYEDDMQEAILRYKFLGARAYAGAFGELVASCIYTELDGKYDILSWVPVSADRYRKRGYDQAELLARAAAKYLCQSAEPVLKKRRGISPQSLTESAEERRANITGAYRVLDAQQVAGKRVLLVDDIVTTGSTLSECAKTLLLAGADEVLCATLARTR
jgi:ComF family protein